MNGTWALPLLIHGWQRLLGGTANHLTPEGVAFDKPSEESHHAGKVPYLCIRLRRSHLCYHFDIRHTRFHPLGRNFMT